MFNIKQSNIQAVKVMNTNDVYADFAIIWEMIKLLCEVKTLRWYTR